MGATGRPPAPTLPEGDLGELQRRVLGTVAVCVDRAAAGHAPTPVSEDPWQAECVADGLRVLLAALPTVTETSTGSDPVDPVAATDTATLLARAGEALDRVAEASRRASVAFAVVGQEVAADIADSLMTVALALRMLVEIARGGSHA